MKFATISAYFFVIYTTKAHSSGFKAPYTLDEGLARTLEFEFVHPRTDNITFKSE